MTEPIEYTEHRYGVKVDARELKIDLAVQRSTVPARVRKIAANFDENLVGELLVSERPEGLYILDGHHRTSAARELNGSAPAYLMAEVFTGLSKADEARLFMGRNDRANVARVDHDRNLATSGDPVTLDIQMAAQSAGFVFVSDHAEDSTFRDRAAGVAIMKAGERSKRTEEDGPGHLAHVFAFYARVWGNQERVNSLVLKAISRIFLGKSEADEDRLYDKLRGLPPQQLVAMTNERWRELSLTRGITKVTAAIEVIAEVYNRGLPTDSNKRIKI